MRGVRLAVVLMAVSPFALGAQEGRGQAGSSSDTNAATARASNTAALRAMLQAAAARKRAGTDVVLRRDARLHGRPTADAGDVELLLAGTMVRKGTLKLTNTAGTWRHVNIEGREGGWILESELPQ